MTKPLKNKLQKDNINIGKNELLLVENFFYYDDVKSALQGLLNDIEKLNKNSRDCKIISISYKDLENISFENGYQLAMKKCIKLIKKWFSDVVKDGEKYIQD